jgi:hypothetical protein
MNVWMLVIYVDTITWFCFLHCRSGAIPINATLEQASSRNNSHSTTKRQEASRREGKGGGSTNTRRAGGNERGGRGVHSLLKYK